MRVAVLLLAVPLTVFLALLAVPGLDRSWGSSSFHFYVVSAASLLSAAVCVALMLSARSIRETKILFLALCFFGLAVIFSVHGLTTPGHLYHLPSAALGRSPWLSTLTGASFAALSVVSIPVLTQRARLRLPELTFALLVALVALYLFVSLSFPDWLPRFPP